MTKCAASPKATEAEVEERIAEMVRLLAEWRAAYQMVTDLTLSLRQSELGREAQDICDKLYALGHKL